MKLKFIILISFLVILLLSGCNQDPVKKDLLYYDEQMCQLDAIHKTVSTDLIITKGIKNVSEKKNFLNEKAIPHYQDMLAKLKTIKPQTPEVRQFHEAIIDMDTTVYNKLVVLATENTDVNLISQAKEKDEFNKKASAYGRYLYSLAKKHNVELKMLNSKTPIAGPLK